MKRYTVTTLSVPAEGGAIEADCGDITFINYGNRASPPVGAVLIVDSVIKIGPGQEYIIAASSPEELNITKHRFQWDTATSAITDGVVVRKQYVK